MRVVKVVEYRTGKSCEQRLKSIPRGKLLTESIETIVSSEFSDFRVRLKLGYLHDLEYIIIPTLRCGSDILEAENKC